MMDSVAIILPSNLNTTISLGNHFTKEIQHRTGGKISGSVSLNKRMLGYHGAGIRSSSKDLLPQEGIKEKPKKSSNHRIAAGHRQK